MGKQINIKINLSNRWLYTLIVIGILIAGGVGVYSATYSSSGAGHPYTEISTCGANQILKMNAAGNAWTCVDMSSAGIVEADPQVGIISAGSWCAATGTAINCDQSRPPYVTTISVVGNPTMSCDDMCGAASRSCIAAFNAASDNTVGCNSRPVDNWFCTGCDSEKVYCLCS
jgi:hypothetical protein